MSLRLVTNQIDGVCDGENSAFRDRVGRFRGRRPFWRARTADDAAATAALGVYNTLQAIVLERSRTVGMNFADTDPLTFLLFIRRQGLVIAATAVVTYPGMDPAIKQGAVMVVLTLALFEERQMLASWLNTLHERQRRRGQPLSPAPKELFIAQPILRTLSLATLLQSPSLPASLRLMVEPLTSLLTVLPDTLNPQPTQNPNVSLVKFENALLALDYHLYFRFELHPGALDFFGTALYRLGERLTYQVGQERWSGRLARRLWVDDPKPVDAFQVGDANGVVGVDEVESQSEGEQIWAILQQAKGDTKPAVLKLPFWDPSVKALAEKAFPKTSLEDVVKRLRRSLFTHEFLHRWWRSTRIDYSTSELAGYFRRRVTDSDPLALANEYASYVGTAALDPSAPWEMVRWVDSIGVDSVLFNRILRDFIAEVSLTRPDLFNAIPVSDKDLAPDERIAFLKAVSTLSVEDIQAAARALYERNVGPLMPAIIPVSSRAQLLEGSPSEKFTLAAA